MAGKCVKHVVVDSGGFILNAPISEIGVKIYSIPEVVNEIRDKTTRQRLQVLPYDIIFRQPSPEAIKCVTDFSKKTGDYLSLSAVDLRVLALVYMLEKEHVGTEHIRREPLRKTEWTSTKKQLEKPTQIAGFYLGKKSNSDQEPVSENQDMETSNQMVEETMDENEATTITSSENQDKNVNECDQPSSEQRSKMNVNEGDLIPSDMIQERSDSEDEAENEEEDDDDDEGWITPGNIAQIREKMGVPNAQKAEVEVGCITTDFAMQNVLIQMHLNVISVDGMLIKRAKSYVLRCSACSKITTNMTKEFCPNCGNKTLQRVSMSVDDDGTIHYYLSRRKPTTRRGLKYSLPAPKGGKHSNNPILVADQKEAHQRTTRASKQKMDVFDPDYVANSSPFALNDTTSRAALLGIRDHKHNFRNRRNPNENKKVYGRRK